MSAVISACGLYRLRLDRLVGDSGPVVAIGGVNPSTADATVNDQTIRKDMGFGRTLGWQRIIKFNKFAYRATDVKELARVVDPVGPGNDEMIEQILRECDLAIAAWGPLSKLPRHLRSRWERVADIAACVGRDFWCFGTANDGQPRHTLMLPYSTPLEPWPPLA